jgi:hypothetical protein
MRNKSPRRLWLVLTLIFLGSLTLGLLWRFPTFISVTWDHVRDDGLGYRRHLEAAASPPGYSHSRTLNFSHIYVVSLAHRHDRRERMANIAAALGIDLTFVDATSTAEKDHQLIQWLGERAYETRMLKRDHLARALHTHPEKVGGLGIDTIWLGMTGWKLDGAHKPLDLPSLSNQSRWKGKDWMGYFDEVERTGQISSLAPDDADFNVTAALYDPLEKISGRQVVPAVVATWHSHVKAIKAILSNGDESALILEDDVDVSVSLSVGSAGGVLMHPLST